MRWHSGAISITKYRWHPNYGNRRHFSANFHQVIFIFIDENVVINNIHSVFVPLCNMMQLHSWNITNEHNKISIIFYIRCSIEIKDNAQHFLILHCSMHNILFHLMECDEEQILDIAIRMACGIFLIIWNKCILLGVNKASHKRCDKPSTQKVISRESERERESEQSAKPTWT